MVAFDDSKFYLGQPCKVPHLFEDTDKTLRRKTSRSCIACERIRSVAHAKTEKGRAAIEARRKRLKGQDDPVAIRLGVDLSKYYLGNLCYQGHDYQRTGRSLRIQGGSTCLECARIVKARHAAKPEAIEKRKQYFEWYTKSEQFKANQRRYKNSEKGIATRRENDKDYNQREDVKRRKREFANSARGRAYKQAYAATYNQSERRKQSLKRYTSSEKGRANLLRNGRLRRARKMSNHAHPYTNEQLKQHFRQFGDRCSYCQRQDVKLTVDHMIPVARGGSECLFNILPACGRCNRSKSAYDVYEWFQKQPFFKESRWREILRLLGKKPENYNQIPLL